MIDSIIRFSIERRYFVFSCLLLIVGAGIWSAQKLPIDAVPDITNIQVQINSEAPGYSPLEVEQRITFPIENQLAGMPRLSYTRSLSRYGLSQVTVVFAEGTDIYFARNLIQEKITSIKNSLPIGIEPEMGPISTGLGEIFTYIVKPAPGSEDKYDTLALRELQDWVIQPQLAQVPGVVEINTIGGYDKQYHVTPDPLKLAQYSLSPNQVAQAVIENNQNQGAGFIEHNGQQLLVRSPGQLASVSDIENIPIPNSLNTPLSLKDVANVAIGKELRTGAATENGRETVMGTAMMLMGENSRTVAKRVEQKLISIQDSLPDGVIVTPVYTRTALVDKTISTISTNLMEGALLVIAVLLLLLGNLRAALITAIIIPLSMLTTIFGMNISGVSANLMSLGALDFGLIIDGTVIIVENCVRRLSQNASNTLSKKERLHIVFEATREVSAPSVFGVTIITLVYIPIFTLTGVEGKMFHPMAITVVIALLAALCFSLTIVPAAIAIFLNRPEKEKNNPIVTYTTHFYRKTLSSSLQFPKTIVATAVIIIVLGGLVTTRLGTEFIPQLDEGDIALHAMRIPGTGLEQSTGMQIQLEKKLTQLPEIKRVFSKIGTPEIATDPMPPNVADTFVMLNNRSAWPNPEKDKALLLEEIQALLRNVPGNNYEYTQPIQMRFNELISGVRADVGIKLFGDDLSLLASTAQNISEAVENIPGATDVRVEQITRLPTLQIIPKRTQLAQYQISLNNLQQQLSTYLAGQEAGWIYEGDRKFLVVVRLPEDIRRDHRNYSELPIQLPGGLSVPLSELAQVSLEELPNQVSRENGKRRIIVSVNVRGRDLGGFVKEAKEIIATQVDLPSGYWLDFGGTFEQLESASKRLGIVAPLTLLAIFGILLLAFSSVKDSLIIFSGIPLALTGGVITLWLRDMPLSISAGVGFIALSGIAVLNGIVLLTFIRKLRTEHVSKTLDETVLDAAEVRLRPILMTALVASLGFVPMALNTGIGAEVQRPLATVVVGGILSSTLLTLYVLPALYLLFHRRKESFRSQA